MYDITTIFILLFTGLVVGFVNTLAGGGSTLMYPVLIFLGMPIHTAIGTSRVSFLAQGIFSVAGFKSKGIFLFPFNLYVALSSLLGGLLGAWIGLKISGENMTKILVIVMIMIAFLILFQSRINYSGLEKRIQGKSLWISLLIFFFIGLYGGFIQAGTGFLIIIALMLYNRLSITEANSIKGLVVLIFTIPALILYLKAGHVDWTAGFILAAGTALGAWLTSRWSVQIPEKYIRSFLTLMILFMAAKLWFTA